MKKFYLIAAMTLCALTASAQQKLTISTYAGTNLANFDGKECTISMYRYTCQGWNTISLPFAMSEEQLNETFGSDCRLERLVGVDNEGQSIVLNFQDCKAGGLEANVPYILYYSGESATKAVKATALVAQKEAALRFTDKYGTVVTMACAQKQTPAEGLYGVLARDNAEASFVNVDNTANGFYATRCFVKLSNGNSTPLITRHLAPTDFTSINAIARPGEAVDVFTLSGVKVASNIRAAEVSSLQPNVYVIKGHKVLVK